MVKLRKIKDEKDARACLKSVSRSGETLREWAKRHRIDGRSLHAWRRNLSRRTTSATAGSARLVELVPVAGSASVARRYIVRVGSAAIEVGDDFDAETLRRLLEALRAC